MDSCAALRCAHILQRSANFDGIVSVVSVHSLERGAPLRLLEMRI